MYSDSVASEENLFELKSNVMINGTVMTRTTTCT